VLEKLRTPLRNPDFAPFLQKVRDAKPDALFVFLPSGQGAQFMKQFAERGLDKAGIKLIGTGDVTDDDHPERHGRRGPGRGQCAPLLGLAQLAVNKKFVDAFQAANKFRPNFMAVGGYDGMRVIYKAVKATKGAGGEALLAAMKGQVFESPRGQVLHRCADARHRAGHLHPQGREEGRPALERRVRRHQGREGPRQEQVIPPEAPSAPPPQGGDASGPAKPVPRRPLGNTLRLPPLC
jgi:hypothetical protein